MNRNVHYEIELLRGCARDDPTAQRRFATMGYRGEAFRAVLENAVARAESTAVVLLSGDETERMKVWSWWRRGRVELHPEQQLTVLLASA